MDGTRWGIGETDITRGPKEGESLPRSSLHFKAVDLAAVLLLTIVGVWITATNYRQTYDDAYITYRYAANLATGHGFVYNIGEKFLGTTAPLYGLILGLLGIPGPAHIPTISGIVSGLSVVASALSLYCFGRINAQRFCGLLAGLFYLTCPILPVTFGGEMPFLVALVLWAFVAYAGRHTGAATVLLVLAILTRPDALLAVPLLLGHYLVVYRRLPWREIALATAGLACGILALWLGSGSPLPDTLRAKLAQRDSGLWEGKTFIVGTVEWFKAYSIAGSSRLFDTVPAAPHLYRFAILIPLGVAAALIRYRWWLLPLGWVALYTIAYAVLDVPFYHWYVVPIICGLAILAAAGVAGIVECIQQLYERWGRPNEGRAARVLGVLCAITLLALGPGLRDELRYEQARAAAGPDPRVRAYQAVGEWLDAHVPPTATVGYLEIGYLGYYARRTVIDPLGLVNRGVDTHVAERDLAWAYETYRPDYIVSYPVFWPQINGIPTEYWFKREYRPVAQFPSDTSQPIAIYERLGPQRYDVPPLLPNTAPANGAVETVNGRGKAQYGNAPIPVTRAQGLTVAGWAIDSAAGGPAGAALVTIDGQESRSGWYGRNRPDIATQLHDPNARDVGFWIYVPPSMLATGTHTIEVRIVRHDLTAIAALPPFSVNIV